jgi:hypothetical protein
MSNNSFYLHITQDDKYGCSGYSEKIERLALSIYEIIKNTSTGHEALKSHWETLPEEERNFYREHIRQIPDALVLLQYDIVSVIEKPKPIKLSEKEIVSLAEHTHEHWFAQ